MIGLSPKTEPITMTLNTREEKTKVTACFVRATLHRHLDKKELNTALVDYRKMLVEMNETMAKRKAQK